jgi:hypothetical protein
VDINELENTPVWDLYLKCKNFMERRGIYEETDINNRMYNGDQWYGLEAAGVEKIVFNIIKPIIKHKTGIITSNLYAINYSPENIENAEFIPVAQKACDLLNKRASKVWDSDFMDKKVKKWSKQAAIVDEAICYVTYDFETNNPVNEIISKNDIMYGDENEEEIQLQPYILIRQRKTIAELQEMARLAKIDEKLIENITPDKDTSSIAGDAGKEEVDDKCWLITKLYRKDGVIYFDQATRYCEIKKEKNMGIKLYPIAHFNWEDEEGNARGIGEARQLRPNQLEINKTAMRRALTVKNISYPQKVVNETAIQNIDAVNKIGATIRFQDMGNTRASDVFMTTTPGQMGPDSEKLQNELITYSRELNNAGDATTGNINPESASGRAILAVQNAQNQPLTDQLVNLKSFLEDIARIWFELWKTYAQDALTIQVDETDLITGEQSSEMLKIPTFILDELETSVKVDITPKGSFDRYAQELSLENLLSTGIITFEEYVESLDADSVMPKSKLETIVKKRKEAQERINALDMQGRAIKQQMLKQQTMAQDAVGFVPGTNTNNQAATAGA